ncbi:helix-turn-helix transcriptional regulator [Planomonospora sp. ID91781]|uniref:helix-turn-helix domain-containing protein n=1 Tax=Planomonospora sp. ID91781 TaxID=2738135 RepID=UPI0018C42449|nr:helix-turn-helix transcriptional regulator [Planomonospora sp. ID91781]MBG0824905.1 helix-turn-helix transcriptional regulator [Planomonospora sp. ID91781]
MSGKGYQTLLDCRRRGFLLRAHGFTVDQIAVVLSLDHEVSPLRLYRYAAGLTAAQVVAAFNDLDPSGTASLRESRLYDYELWPDGGRRPSAQTLQRLARIYGTTPDRLLADETRTDRGEHERAGLPA